MSLLGQVRGAPIVERSTFSIQSVAGMVTGECVTDKLALWCFIYCELLSNGNLRWETNTVNVVCSIIKKVFSVEQTKQPRFENVFESFAHLSNNVPVN